MVQAITEAARKLGNTPTICRKCYVHPLIIETYMAGKLLEAVEQESSDKDAPWALDAIERHVLHLLQRQIAETRKSERT